MTRMVRGQASIRPEESAEGEKTQNRKHFRAFLGHNSLLAESHPFGYNPPPLTARRVDRTAGFATYRCRRPRTGVPTDSHAFLKAWRPKQ